MLPLSVAQPGEKNIIIKITGKDDVRQHLAKLGFVAGAEVTIISANGNNMILLIKESRIGLDKSLANRIMV